MKKVEVVDLYGVDYSKMTDRINEVMTALQADGKQVYDFRVIGSALNKCAVFIMYEE
ncbi:MAG: hypothetical protein RBU23_04125 [Candidatus Auribacterota bacterium]|nr:hypothetical protein [Candidatus Auribacterota bacterium]